jgi:hypothetical protein
VASRGAHETLEVAAIQRDNVVPVGREQDDCGVNRV